MAMTRGSAARSSRSCTDGSVTPSLSGCTPTVLQKLSWASASACTSPNSSMVVQMHSARVTRASSMAWRMAGSCADSSGKLRWQCESVNMAAGMLGGAGRHGRRRTAERPGSGLRNGSPSSRNGGAGTGPRRPIRRQDSGPSGRGGPAQMVCVGRSEDRVEPRISSMRALSRRDLSSLGNWMPMPCVRLPAARAGVTQATRPATG